MRFETEDAAERRFAIHGFVAFNYVIKTLTQILFADTLE